ncbi:MAG: tetratricopeptide repeat protein [Pseudomonadales bacterium]|nr:tetratricopeptide repeat protein [Pseudomonadales bacterium]
MFPGFMVLVLALFSGASHAFTGSEACKSCHATEFTNWEGSHHDLAMQLPTADTVLGDFNDATFTYNGTTTRFFREGDEFKVRTDGEDGKLADFTVKYVFGVYPLQQYLLPLSRGRLQALSIAWDARPAAEGGQRWYHLYPDDVIDFKDPLHWTGPYQNWNSRCAECHSTDLEKNYNAADHSFATTFEEINVGCEACHGPGEKHLELAAANKLKGAANGGFPTALAQRGEWAWTEGEAIARRSTPLDSRAQVDSCGRCHSRRGTLGEYHYGADLLATHRVALPQPPLYHYDGQVLDEDYVYGSFLQSKMHQQGVVCSNCHEPHSLALRAPGNEVCAQCHQPQSYDTPEHHHHPAQSSGALCANCHMPETTYMGVDPRRDHSMRIPRPDLSVVMGTPNACNSCHVDKNAEWSVNSLRDWGVQFRDTGTHFARAFQRFDLGDRSVLPTLAALANDPSAAPIWRATAMEAVAQGGGREAIQTVTGVLYDDDPILRASAVRSLGFLPLNQRYQLLQSLMDDQVATVRMEVAQSLAGVPLDQVTPAQAAELESLYKWYLDILTLHAEMPETQLQLGVFYLERGELQSAEAAYREALRLNPQLVPAYLNLADLLRGQNRDGEARELMLKVLEFAPDNGPTLHSLGLLETRSGTPDKALDYLRRAAELETDGSRHRFVYAIALHDLGQPKQAIAQLQILLRQLPRSEDVLLALTNYSAELGLREQARRYAQTLVGISPGNQSYQQLLQQLK